MMQEQFHVVNDPWQSGIISAATLSMLNYGTLPQANHLDYEDILRQPGSEFMYWTQSGV